MKFIKVYYYGPKNISVIKPIEEGGRSLKKSSFHLHPTIKDDNQEHCHEVFLHSSIEKHLYDLTKDESHFWEKAVSIAKRQGIHSYATKETILNNLDWLILEAGYQGFVDQKLNQMAIFNQEISILKPLGAHIINEHFELQNDNNPIRLIS